MQEKDLHIFQYSTSPGELWLIQACYLQRLHVPDLNDSNLAYKCWSHIDIKGVCSPVLLAHATS